jgi:gas vesicle protein
MTPSDLTSIGALVVSVTSVLVLPLVFRRQSAKRERIKEDARRDAALASEETVSWEKINQALAATIATERVANREKLAELRESFQAETERLKRLTDNELDRAKAEIDRLATQIRDLESRIADQAQRLEGRSARGGS